MNVSSNSKRGLKSIAIFTALTSAGATVNAIIEHGFTIYPIVSELIIGFLFGLIISISEVFFFEKKLRRLNFSILLLVRSVFYTLVCATVIVAVAASRIGKESDINYYNALSHEDLKAYLLSSDFIEMLVYSVVLSFFVNLIRQINRLLGQNVLLNYSSGKYHPAIREDLIFMFLDLKSSTSIAERLGLIKNHEFLDDFFYDMTEPVLECKGKIYQYVGDEVILTWSLKKGLKDFNCIRCFFLIQQKIEGKKNVYIDKYGIWPEFKAGIHFGGVITGEIGDIKKDIVYHGDTMNTTARIQAECNTYGKKVLISRRLLDLLSLNGEFKIESLGTIMLRGKQEKLELLSVEEM